MKCRICEQGITVGRSPNQHHLEQSPIDEGLCLGCWTARTQLELFLVRAIDRTVMGNWTEGWLREILADPKRYL